MENTYIEKLNKGSIYKADLEACEDLFSKIVDFDPKTICSIPGCVSITAMTGAGKTILIRDFLKQTEDHFKEVHLISRTAKSQSIYDFIPRDNIKDDFDEDFLSSLYQQRKLKKLNNNKVSLDPVLIIFDDIINDPMYKKSKIIDNIFTEGRHYNISVWFLTQNFTSLKQLQRNNVRWAISFCHDTALERDKFSSSYLSVQNDRIGRLLFNKITKEKPYQCVVVEVYKVGVDPCEKIKKYIANPDVKDPKVKPVDKTIVVYSIESVVDKKDDKITHVTYTGNPISSEYI